MEKIPTPCQLNYQESAVDMKIYATKRLYLLPIFSLCLLIRIAFYLTETIVSFHLVDAILLALPIVHVATGKKFAQIDHNHLIIFGLFGRIRWQSPIAETQFSYKQIWFNDRNIYYLTLTHHGQSKKIELNHCEFKGFGLLMDLNELAPTPFFSKMEQNLHTESLNWKLACKQSTNHNEPNP